MIIKIEIKKGTLLLLREQSYFKVFLPMVVEYLGAKERLDETGMRSLVHIVLDIRRYNELTFPSLLELGLDYQPIERIGE